MKANFVDKHSGSDPNENWGHLAASSQNSALKKRPIHKITFKKKAPS